MDGSGCGRWIHAPAEGAPWGRIWMLVIKKGGSWLQPSFLWAVSHKAATKLREGLFCTSLDKVEMEGSRESWLPGCIWLSLHSHPQSPLYFSVPLTAIVINHFSHYLFTTCFHPGSRAPGSELSLRRAWQAAGPSSIMKTKTPIPQNALDRCLCWVIQLSL